MPWPRSRNASAAVRGIFASTSITPLSQWIRGADTASPATWRNLHSFLQTILCTDDKFYWSCSNSRP